LTRLLYYFYIGHFWKGTQMCWKVKQNKAKHYRYLYPRAKKSIFSKAVFVGQLDSAEYDWRASASNKLVTNFLVKF